MLLLIGYLAGLLNAISLIPEIWKTLHTHHLKDVSWGTLFFFAFSAAMWELYGLHIQDYPIIISDGINLIMALFLIILKLKYTDFKKPKFFQKEEKAY